MIRHKAAKLVSDLAQFADEEGAIEIITRNAKGKIIAMERYIVSKNPNSDVAKELVNKVNALLKTKDSVKKTTELIGSLSIFNSLLGVANLCTTAVGFLIINEKLKTISNDIQEVIDVVKKQGDAEANYKFNDVVSKYQRMLDKKRLGDSISEDEYLELISLENNVLKYLCDGFEKDIVNDVSKTLYAILALSSMMAVTIIEYDKRYYFNHIEATRGKERFYLYRTEWFDTYNRIKSEVFMDKLLNYVFIKNGCNQRESDVFVSSYRNKINNLIADITDASFLIALCPDIESYSSVMHDIDAIAIETVEEQADNQEAKEIVKIAVNELQMA